MLQEAGSKLHAWRYLGSAQHLLSIVWGKATETLQVGSQTSSLQVSVICNGQRSERLLQRVQAMDSIQGDTLHGSSLPMAIIESAPVEMTDMLEDTDMETYPAVFNTVGSVSEATGAPETVVGSKAPESLEESPFVAAAHDSKSIFFGFGRR